MATLEPAESVDEKDFKIVVIGDGAVGKTALCQVYVNGEFPTGYVPTVFESDSFVVKNGEKVTWEKEENRVWGGSFVIQSSMDYILGEKGWCVGHCWSGGLSRDAEVGAVI